MLRKLLVAAMAMAISLAGTVPVFAQASDSSGAAGAVYLMNNAASGNQVLAYARAGDGSLAFLGSFATGGLGSGVGIAVPPDPLGSQNSLIVSPDGRWVFAVNAGSDEISSFMVTSQGLSLADKVGSRGGYPVSLTYLDGLLYVLNAAGQGSIAGFEVKKDGHLKHLEGSDRSLDAATPSSGAQPNIGEAPGQVKFSPDGDFLVITDKGGVSGIGRLLVFKVANELPSAQPAITSTQNKSPFSLTFDNNGHPLVVDAGAGTVTSYTIQGNGGLNVKDVELTNQAASCWIANSGSFIYTDNTGSGTISGFTPSPSGKLTPLTANSVLISTIGAAPLDMGISQDGRYLYSLETGSGIVEDFAIAADGSLTSLGAVATFPAVSGFQGIAVH